MPGAYGARHARARPSVRQWVLAIRETMVIKPSRLNIVAQDLSNSLPRSIISPYTHLSLSDGLWPDCRQAGWWSPLREKRGRAASSLYTHRQASLVVSHYTTLVPPPRLCTSTTLNYSEVLGRELKQARSKPDTVDQPVRTAHIFVHHYNSTQYCKTETFFLTFPFLQTNITSQMWPSGGKGEFTWNSTVAQWSIIIRLSRKIHVCWWWAVLHELIHFSQKN